MRTDASIPNQADMAFIDSLMQPCLEPGRHASWIAAPRAAIDQQPGDFEYVKPA